MRMAQRVQVQKAKQAQSTACTDDVRTTAHTASSTETADLLDEIDLVLETNAQDFVESYVQKGGE